MISIVQLCDNLYSAKDAQNNFLHFQKDSEDVDASALCTMIKGRGNWLGQWLRSKTTSSLINDLEWYLDDTGNIPYFVDGTVKNHTFIHPSLVGSLVIWLDPRYNYSICKLMQAIIRNSAIDNEVLEKKKKDTHYLTVYEICDTKLGPLKRYRVYEGTKETFATGNEIIMKTHPQANIVFQQRKVPNNVEVTHVLYDDSENFGRVCMDKKGYCGTTMDKPLFLDFLQDCCKTHAEPYILNANIYDVPDCANLV